MLSKAEFTIKYDNGKKLVFCDRIDMIDGVEEELLQGTIFVYKCAPQKESAETWKNVFEDFTKRRFVISSSKLSGGPRAIFMGRYCCVHRPAPRTRPRKKAQFSKRDFGCPTMLVVKIENPTRTKRSKRPPTDGYNMRIVSNKQAHTHSLERALPFRRISADAQAALLQLFDEHHTLASAMETYKLRLLEQLGDKYLEEASDRSVLPDKNAAYRLYYETYRKRYGDLTRKQVRKLQQDAAKRRQLGQKPLKHTASSAAGGSLSTSVATSAGMVTVSVSTSVGGLPAALPASAATATVASPTSAAVATVLPPTASSVKMLTAAPPVADGFKNVFTGKTKTSGSHELVTPKPGGAGDAPRVHSPIAVIDCANGESDQDDDTHDFMDTLELDSTDMPINWVTAPAPFGISSEQEVPGGDMVPVSSDVAAAVASLQTTAPHVSNVITYPSAGAGDALLADSAGVVVYETAGEVPDAPEEYVTVPAGGSIVTLPTDCVMSGELESDSVDPLALDDGAVTSTPAAPAGPTDAAAFNSDARVPSVDKLRRAVGEWSTEICDRLSSDSDGEWREAVSAFLENWDRLPAPGRRKALSSFGRVSGLGRPSAAPAPVPRHTALPTESVSTQTGYDDPTPEGRPGSFVLCVIRNDHDYLAEVPVMRPRYKHVLPKLFGLV
ncbi:uncharacterized protein LOC122385585 [Amphibalanus amphitrite]|uniref:uncharacterized protein LOC122385585 n=1 Tax=Amphibalanus amphitrite TaxID=1232801 RepID=UPI001C901E4D|nr:uncharacterized protein LOC122385585 [Amphibalanus amphitrite]XP_043229891.1 uncharacterized protein LOC122385585 [Amphibalanus amphitrite]